jgi:hypothetical protein
MLDVINYLFSQFFPFFSGPGDLHICTINTFFACAFFTPFASYLFSLLELHQSAAGRFIIDSSLSSSSSINSKLRAPAVNTEALKP